MQRKPGSSWVAPGVCAAVVASVVFSTSIARADIELGVGLMGAVGGNFLDKADRKAGEPDIYPGYGGLTIGGGLVLDTRFLDGFFGIEADVIRSKDKGNGDVTINGVTITHTIGQSSWHVPVLAKVTIPSPVVAPQFFLGPEFVFPSDPESTTDPKLPGIRATADSYTMITGGIGAEIKLPLPVLDLRIPVGLRVSYNPSVPSDFSDRVKATSGATLTYDSEWKYAVNFTVGAAIWF